MGLLTLLRKLKKVREASGSIYAEMVSGNAVCLEISTPLKLELLFDRVCMFGSSMVIFHDDGQLEPCFS